MKAHRFRKLYKLQGETITCKDEGFKFQNLAIKNVGTKRKLLLMKVECSKEMIKLKKLKSKSAPARWGNL